MNIKIVFIAALLFASKLVNAQVDEGQLGGWYMYFVNTSFSEGPWGVQGDIQYRNWNVAGDLEQLLLRGGLTYKPSSANIKFTLGYGNITTGAPGDEISTVSESRIYQEATFPTKIGERFYLKHRLRYEQRFVDDQDFRTRYRYNLFVTVPLNSKEITDETIYLSVYNEIFINGQRDIGDGRSVQVFDRNRLYTALGYVLNSKIKIQFGVMNQSTNGWKKNQLQLSLHHSI